jgi:hypothetical protein
MTISEALSWKQTLSTRHSELTTLRNQNAVTRRVRYGNEAPVEEKPEYDVKKLDKRITLLAREIRIVGDKIKQANATAQLTNYTADDGVLGELED